MTGSANKRSRPIWIKDMILPDLLLNLIFFAIMAAVATLFLSEKPNLLGLYIQMLWLLIPTFLFFILRRFSLPIVPMLISHIILAILPVFFLQKLPVMVAFWMEVVVIFLMLYSIRKKYQKTLASNSMLVVIVAIMLHFALLFVALLFQQNEMIPYVFSVCLMIICFYLASKQLIDFESSFEHFLTSSTQPGRQIKANNHRIISILTIAMLILIPVTLIIPYDSFLAVLEKVGYVITGVVFFLLSLIPTFQAEGYDETFQIEDPEASQLSPQMSQFVTFIQIVLTVVVIFVLLVGLLKGVVKLILYFRDNYVQKHLTIKFSENENVTDEIFHLDSKREKNRKKVHSFGQGEEKRVRRTYYSTIRRAMAKGLDLQPSSTPGEIQEKIKNQFGTDISELTSTYEEMRYGQQKNETE